MEVNAANFPELLPQILTHIKSSLFCSIDLEFSGIKSTITTQKLGLTCVKVDGSDYKTQSYSFMVTPFLSFLDNASTRQARTRDLERRLIFSASSMEMLMNTGFNFHQALKTGVPYLSRQEQDRLQSNDLIERNVQRKLGVKLPGQFAKIVIEQAEKPWYEKQKKRISEWIINGMTLKKQAQAMRQDVQHCIGLRLIIEALAGNPNLGTYLDCHWYGHRHASHNVHVCDEDMAAMSEATSTLQDLCDEYSTLPQTNPEFPYLVGHNILWDLAFLHQCFVRDLPKCYDEFQTSIHSMFPRILDTKVMTSTIDSTLTNYSLTSIWRRISNTVPEIKVEIPYDAFQCGVAHDAAYDSYVTACVAISIIREHTGQRLGDWNGDNLKEFRNRLGLRNDT
ncbi:Poly(A)-specific ribonuclease PARN-like domain-containing protein 1 [Ceratocystis fimbriata CBS 114723]|uniref:Poly(A)-specific ribonuclease PARN-like domain-containing protein 1 n=1 Tax=Ceratocystis fimbriata CBS 114723 TaxID=1035309 RepID=A0A2C5WY00_9PEZI|nr:Poly(A)-specific ribonuclease PARN-like domain-containing protein 1 [Ceratocystis fimbriata CBS 114723]